MTTPTTTARTEAIVVTRTGGGEVLELTEVDLPEPPPGSLQVRVIASGINFMDVYQRQGIYPVPTPFTLGVEGAGEVVALGPGTTGVAVGDTVAWATGLGSHAGRLNLPAANAVAVPAGLDPQIAAAAMLQGMTAHYLTHSTYPIASGDTVLIHAAAGGTGQLLVQLAKRRGATVIGVVSNDEKAAKARGAGADIVLDSRQTPDPDSMAAAVRAANGGAGVDAVYDGVGRTTFDASLASLRPRGMLVIFGAASGQVPPFDVQRLNAGGSLFVTRPTLAHYIATPEELRWRSGQVLGAAADGSLRVEIGGSYPLAEARRAYAALEGRSTTGKVILTR